VPTTLNVDKADLNVESAYLRPEFGLFKDTAALFQRLFVRLQPHSPQLQNMTIERGAPSTIGANSIGEFHVMCQLYNWRAGIRVYTEKVTISCVNVLENEVDAFTSLIINALLAVKDHQPAISYRTHTLSAVLHGRLEGRSVDEYLGNWFSGTMPRALGPHIATGGVIYFGSDEDRILSTITLDRSTLVPDGLFVRPFVVWDGGKVDVDNLAARATAFVVQALAAFGLEISALRGRQ
jgi:hypothetical protein